MAGRANPLDSGAAAKDEEMEMEMAMEVEVEEEEKEDERRDAGKREESCAQGVRRRTTRGDEDFVQGSAFRLGRRGRDCPSL